MDLAAYAQIGNLEQYMVDNGIFVPRIRGLRLMKNEEPIDRERIEGRAKWIGLSECESACESGFIWNPSLFTISEETRRIKHRYLVYDKKYHEPIGIQWNNVHGKKRKLFKYNMRMALKRTKRNLETFNKYCGREDILYIHARIGGGNWPHYRKEVENQPWFIEKVDDPFDSTYCDIYARIEVKPDVEQQAPYEE